MINLTFAPIDDTFIPAADEYDRIWRADGKRIALAIENATRLKFKETSVAVTVFEGVSRSNPMQLRASYDANTKKATLVHELLHRISEEYMLKLPIKGEDLTLGLHKQIDLLLYDVWIELYGREFADTQVQNESSRTPTYKEAWKWALSLSPGERHAKFTDLCS